MSNTTTCRHCGRTIITTAADHWVDPEATGDDAVWRETCDSHETFTAEHEPTRSKIYETWVKRIDTDEPLSEGQVKQYCQAIYAVGAGYDAGGKRTNLTDEEAYNLCDLFVEHDGTNITEQQTAKGIKYIKRYASKIGLPEGNVIGFRFVDVRERWGSYRPSFVPVYRTYLDDGRAYEYSVTPWQSGADVEWCWVTTQAQAS